MSEIELFRTWAPAESIWSPWAKPVLFANAPAQSPPLPQEWPPIHLPLRTDLAIILELPGDDSIALAIALARIGFRPVPLFNCAPGSVPAVPWESLVHRLRAGAGELLSLNLPAEAPPVFLLDSRRMKPTRPLTPGVFDNRWIVFPQDFPSAGFLKAHGIREALLLQESLGMQPADDLSHVLLRWQAAGMALHTAALAHPAASSPLQVREPRMFGSIFYRVLVALGLRRNNAGGFGGVIPQPSSSTG